MAYGEKKHSCDSLTGNAVHDLIPVLFTTYKYNSPYNGVI